MLKAQSSFRFHKELQKGYLRKRGAIRKSWKERYFVLSCSENGHDFPSSSSPPNSNNINVRYKLTYFASELDARANVKPCGSIPILWNTRTYITKDEKGDITENTFAFKIDNTLFGGRRLKVEGKTEQTRHEWMTTISSCIDEERERRNMLGSGRSLGSSRGCNSPSGWTTFDDELKAISSDHSSFKIGSYSSEGEGQRQRQKSRGGSVDSVDSIASTGKSGNNHSLKSQSRVTLSTSVNNNSGIGFKSVLDAAFHINRLESQLRDQKEGMAELYEQLVGEKKISCKTSSITTNISAASKYGGGVTWQMLSDQITQLQEENSRLKCAHPLKNEK